jgi:hypothetical protein
MTIGLEKDEGSVMPEECNVQDAATADRREVLRRFGTYAAYTAPGMMVLLGSRQAGAMSSSNGSSKNRAAGFSG